MLVADCASEALTTEDELRRERSGVQCEARASLSALRRELPPALSSCGFCYSSTLCLGFRACACTFDPHIRLLGGSLSPGPEVSKEGRLHCLDDFEQSNNTAMLVPQHQHKSTYFQALMRGQWRAWS